jgi:hypothetical protein
MHRMPSQQGLSRTENQQEHHSSNDQEQKQRQSNKERQTRAAGSQFSACACPIPLGQRGSDGRAYGDTDCAPQGKVVKYQAEGNAEARFMAIPAPSMLSSRRSDRTLYDSPFIDAPPHLLATSIPHCWQQDISHLGNLCCPPGQYAWGVGSVSRQSSHTMTTAGIRRWKRNLAELVDGELAPHRATS